MRTKTEIIKCDQCHCVLKETEVYLLNLTFHSYDSDECEELVDQVIGFEYCFGCTTDFRIKFLPQLKKQDGS